MLGEEAGVRGSSSDIEHFSAQQILVRRNRTAVRISGEQHSSLRSDYVLNERQNSIEGKQPLRLSSDREIDESNKERNIIITPQREVERGVKLEEEEKE